MLLDSTESNHAVLVNRQPYKNEDIDTCNNIPFLISGSLVVVQHKDVEMWLHGTIIGYVSDDHNGRSYRMRENKAGCIIKRT